MNVGFNPVQQNRSLANNNRQQAAFGGKIQLDTQSIIERCSSENAKYYFEQLKAFKPEVEEAARGKGTMLNIKAYTNNPGGELFVNGRVVKTINGTGELLPGSNKLREGAVTVIGKENGYHRLFEWNGLAGCIDSAKAALKRNIRELAAENPLMHFVSPQERMQRQKAILERKFNNIF